MKKKAINWKLVSVFVLCWAIVASQVIAAEIHSALADIDLTSAERMTDDEAMNIAGEIMEQPASIGTGMTYMLPAGAQGLPDHANRTTVGMLSGNSFVGWYRYPAEEQTWLAMTGATAYYRDVTVGGQTYISGAADGETWTASGLRPDGTTLNWGAITFHSSYNGNQNCFVSPYWIICNTTSLSVLWYTNSQCAKPGQWTMTFYNNGVQFYQGTFKVLPQIPPGKVPSGATYNQLAYPDHYDNRCWKTGSSPRRTTTCNATNTEQCTIAQLGCFLTGSCMILGYHGVTVTSAALNTWLNTNNGYQLGDVDPYAVAKYARDHGKQVYFAGRAATSALAGPSSRTSASRAARSTITSSR